MSYIYWDCCGCQRKGVGWTNSSGYIVRVPIFFIKIIMLLHGDELICWRIRSGDPLVCVPHHHLTPLIVVFACFRDLSTNLNIWWRMLKTPICSWLPHKIGDKNRCARLLPWSAAGLCAVRVRNVFFFDAVGLTSYPRSGVEKCATPLFPPPT